jgi:hypothetical protein
MKLLITSPRGHHETVAETEISAAVFDKLIGKKLEPLSVDLKSKLPETFSEVGLYENRKLSYTAFEKVGGEFKVTRQFNPQAEEMMFVAPIIGG